MDAPIKIQSQILEKQEAYLYGKAKEKLGDAATETELRIYVNEAIQLYYKNLGGPLFQARHAEEGQLPFIEEYEDNNEEIDKDLEILFSELDIISKYLVDYFNYAQAEQKRILSVVQGINGLVGDLQMISSDSDVNLVYMKESFADNSMVEPAMTPEDNRAQISTQEGVLTLKRTGSVNQTLNGKVREVIGNGEEGTAHIVRRLGTDENGEIQYQFVADQTPNKDKVAVADGSADSIYEYQMINVPQEFKDQGKNYDFEWAKGNKNDDLLRAKIVIQLEDVMDINWVNINPYHPPNSTGQLAVYSIRTSEDGFEYKGLYDDGDYILNNDLNTTPQSYRLDDLFDGSNDFSASKFAGQGVWSFPTRPAKFIEVVFDQRGSYTELVGQEAYYQRKKDTTAWTRVRKQDVPESIVQGKTGVFSVDSQIEMKKAIEATEGWRYVIGLRDIQVMSYEFTDTSEYISKTFSVPNTTSISEMVLYANEKVPDAYLTKIATQNDWIRYYISFDDITWIEMSPYHRQPVSDTEDFPPKIVSVNGNEADIDKTFQLYRQNIVVSTDPKKVRMKIVLTRPKTDNMNMTTPLVEDYALKILTKEAGL
jgi:hypothetical protein